MSRTSMVVGIDVGSEQKGFHAVALQGGTFVNKTTTTDPAEIVAWCLDQRATVVAVDARYTWADPAQILFRPARCVHVRSVQRQLAGDSLANATTGAGHDCYLVA